MTIPSDDTALAYGEGLTRYIAAPSESTLKTAYEIGRAAIAQGFGMVDIAAAHQRILAHVLADPDRLPPPRLAELTMRFLIEALSPFEMTLRGFKEAVGRLEHEAAERVNAQEELQAAHEQLEERVRQRTADLAAANERLREEIGHRERAEKEAARDFDAMTRLQKLGTLFARDGDLAPILDEIVDAAIAIAGADFGNIQLLDRDTGELRIAAHRGFPQWWLEYWHSVAKGTGVCGTALERGERVVVDDVEASPIFASEPGLDIQLRAGVRAVQSTPLVSRSGRPVGMFSTHYRRPHRPDERTLRLLDLLARQAADIIERAQAEAALRRSEERYRTLHESLRDAFVQVDMEGRIIECNDLYCQMLGYSQEEVCQLTYTSLTPERWHDVESRIVREQIIPRGYSDVYEKEYRRKDGTIFPVELRTVLARDGRGRPVGMWAVIRDITARKQAEQSLSDAERRYRDLVREAPAGIYEIDFRTRRYVSVNDSMCEMLGYSRDELLNMDPLAIMDEDSRARFQARIRKWLGGEEPERNVEYRVRARDGRIFDAVLNVTFTKGPDGRPQGATVVGHDITERKRAEHALRESEALLRAVTDNSPDAIYVKDAESRWLMANPAVLRIVGRTADEALGKTDLELYADPAIGVAIVGNDRRVMANGRTEAFEELADTPDGPRTFVSVKAPRRDAQGKIVGLIGISHDITERKRAEDRAARDLDAMTRLQKLGTLLAREADLGPILDEIVDTAIAIAGADFGNIQLLDPATGELRIVAHRGFPQWWLDFWNSVSKGTGSCGTALQRGERVIVDDVEASPIFAGTPGLDAQLRAGVRAVQSTPLISRSGRPVGMFSTHYRKPHRPDEGALRLLDLLARQAADIIERVQSERALREANAALAEADRRKDEFLAMLAHELRNPLSVVGGASEILQHAGSVEPDVQRARDAIQRQAGHMTRLVDDLLDVSRVTQGKITLQKERVPVATVVAHAVETSSPIIRRLGHRLFVSPPLDSLVVDGDVVRLTQIVSNLLNNAAKYTPAGGEIHLSAEGRGPHVEIRVRDNGQGIDAVLLPHIFDLFVQGDRGADRTQGGLGIGLTMARSLAEMHGGTIEAHSGGPGTGSEFVISLPLAQAEPAHAMTNGRHLEHRASRRILVVDDNADAAEMMRTLLEMDGHEVTAVRDGATAMKHAATWRPDVALIDLGMPGMDGFEVARRLRADPSLNQTVLVALTGYGQEDDVRRSREAGFDHHITKSADFEPLRRVLGSLPVGGEVSARRGTPT